MNLPRSLFAQALVAAAALTPAPVFADPPAADAGAGPPMHRSVVMPRTPPPAGTPSVIPEAPRGSVDWYGRAGEPTREELLRQQSAAIAFMVRCIRGTAPWPAPHAISLVLAFAPDGAVLWTDRDGMTDARRCIADAARSTLRVAPFTGPAPVVVMFPLRGTTW